MISNVRFNRLAGCSIDRAVMGGLSMLLSAIILVPLAAHASDFTPPTKEELAMTSLPGYPGAAAVILFQEQITKDDLHVVYHYDRIKILTDEGKKYADIELPFVSTSDAYDYSGDDKTLGQIEGRTIHADGTIIPFTGKPYLKVIEKGQGVKFQEMVFSLPDVQVGSIIEYRYATRINDNIYEAPDWYIQGELYVKAAHFAWYPTTHELQDEQGRVINTITWFHILPPGAQILHHEMPASGYSDEPQQVYDLTVKDVPPETHEEFMPPISSFTYRVLFNFEPFISVADYWKSEGKNWSKHSNSFINPNSDLRSATNEIVAGATTQDQKLRKIYAAVMALENTDYTRRHDEREDKANHLVRPNNADDVLKRKSGNSTELTELFVGMARAAGMNADLMLVPNRSRELFIPDWLTFRQFDDVIAIVNVDGKEMYFDPGSRYCPYGHLDWVHTFVEGLRQKGNETAFDTTSGDLYTANGVFRVANLNMDSTGQITGTIELGYSGSAALHWRQAALQGDEESLRHELRTTLENMLPKSLDVKVASIDHLSDYEQPLKVTYEVKGTLGTWVGKRLILPADLFLSHEHATFPDQKRELSVYFHYPETIRDALRINFPSTFTIEASPSAAKFKLEDLAAYAMTVAAAPSNFTTRRDYANGTIIIPVKYYPQLHTFYSQFEANDQQSVVLDRGE